MSTPLEISRTSGSGTCDHYRQIVQIDLALYDEIIGVVDAQRLRIVRRLPLQLSNDRFLQFLFEDPQVSICRVTRGG